MKKFVLLIFLILSACLALAQQSPSDSLLMRKHGHLQFAGTNEKLNDSVVQNLLTADDFTLYQQARKKYKIAVPLWVMTGLGFGVATSLHLFGLISMLSDLNNPYGFLVGYLIWGVGFAGAAIVGTLAFFIPALKLTKSSNALLDSVISNYNQRRTSVSLNFGLTRSGVGLTLNF